MYYYIKRQVFLNLSNSNDYLNENNFKNNIRCFETNKNSL